MNKIEFQGLTIQQQVSEINQQLNHGESVTNACINVGMTKELSRKFQKKGFKLIEGQFIPSHVPTQTQEVAVDTITPPKVEEVKKVQNKAKIGRPCKTQETTKLTLEVNKLLVRKLKHYCIDNEVYMNKFIEGLIRNNLK